MGESETCEAVHWAGRFAERFGVRTPAVTRRSGWDSGRGAAWFHPKRRTDEATARTVVKHGKVGTIADRRVRRWVGEKVPHPQRDVLL